MSTISLFLRQTLTAFFSSGASPVMIHSMEAVQIESYGGNEVLTFNRDVPQPIPTENQILVEVYAAGINPVDAKIRSGYLKDYAPLKFPATLGGDFSGVVIAVGSEVTDFKVGDEAFGSAILLNGGSGSFAQFLVAGSANSFLKPDGLDFTQAAALPLAGASAAQAIEDHLKLSQGQRILIHGGAGGIGH